MAEAMKYGKEEFAVTLPAEKIAAELEPNRVELPQRTVAEHIRYALAHPVDSAPLDQLVHAGETVCIVISDVTRRWQSPETYLPILIEELEKAGIRDEDMLILSATGTHRRQTREEHVGMVTEAVYDRIRVVDHQCEDTENLTYVGTTSFGTPVWLDKRALECDHIIHRRCGVPLHGGLRRRPQEHPAGHCRPGDHHEKPQPGPEPRPGQRLPSGGPQRQHDRGQPRPRRHDGGLLHGGPHLLAQRGGE